MTVPRQPARPVSSVVGVFRMLLAVTMLAGATTHVMAQEECGSSLTPTDALILRIREEAGMYQRQGGLAGDWYLGDIRVKWHVLLSPAPASEPVISPEDLEYMISRLNQIFAPLGVGFCADEEIDYIPSPEDWWPTVPASDTTDTLMVMNDEEGALDIYWAEHLEGLLGLASFSWTVDRDSIAMSADWSPFSANWPTATRETLHRVLAHEVGHWFDLLHTHDSQFGLECVDGSNCEVAGDLVCDTPASFNTRNCVGAGCRLSTSGSCIQEGPCSGDGDYDPDVRNFMGYAGDAVVCQDHFTAGQFDRARAALENFRMDYVVAPCPRTVGAASCDAGYIPLMNPGRTRIDGDAHPVWGGPEIVSRDLVDEGLLGNHWFRLTASADGLLSIATEGFPTALVVYPATGSCPGPGDQIAASSVRHDGAIGARVDLQTFEGESYLVRVGIPDDGVPYGDYWLDVSIRQPIFTLSPDHDIREAIEIAPDGAVIQLMPGVHEPNGPIVLAGRNITILGMRPVSFTPDCMGTCFPDIVFENFTNDTFCDDGSFIPSDYKWVEHAPEGIPIWLDCPRFDCDQPGCDTCNEDIGADVDCQDAVDATTAIIRFPDGAGTGMMLVGTDHRTRILGVRFDRDGTAAESGGNITIINETHDMPAASGPLFQQCSFSGSTVGDGGNIVAIGSAPIFRDCTFAGSAGNFGGSIAAVPASEEIKARLSFINCAFTAHAVSGGAVHAADGARTWFHGCDFQGCSALWSGGAIRALDEVELHDCRFGTVLGNTAVLDGGAVAVHDGLLEIQDCLFGTTDFTSNLAGGSGGAIDISGVSGALGISRSTLSGNHAAWGGAVSVREGANLALYQVDFTGNGSDETRRGGAVHVEGASTTIYQFDGLDFSANQASMGGAVHLGPGTALQEIADVDFLANTAFPLFGESDGIGGAMFMESVTPGSTVELLSVRFEGNGAGSTGGALVLVDTDLDMTECDFVANGAGGLGKAMHLVDDSEVLVTASRITGHALHDVDDEASLFHLESDCVLDIDGELICENGPVLYSGGGMLQLDASLCNLPYCDLDEDGISDCVDDVIGSVPSGRPGAIQHAMSRSLEGSTLHLEAGVHTALLPSGPVMQSVDKDLVFEGAVDIEGNPATILSGSGSSRVMLLSTHESEATEFRNIIFADGVSDAGGAVLLLFTEGAGPSFINCRFEANEAIDDPGPGVGGAVALQFADATFVQCDFTDNRSAAEGGAIYLAIHAGAVFEDCRIHDNQSVDPGGGISSDSLQGDACSLVSTIVCANVPDQIAGDMLVDESSCLSELCIDADEDDVPEDCDTASPCPADINADRVVDGIDLSHILGSWATADEAADINGDGNVDGADLNHVLAAWGVCPE